MSVLASRQAQVDRALVSANAQKFSRLDLKAEVHSQGVQGADTVAALILDSAPLVRRVLVWQLVQWVVWLGEVKAEKMLRLCGVDSWTRVGRLSDGQREALAVQLRRHAQGLRLYVSRRSGPAPRHHGNPVCSTCREHLRRPSEDGLCGFCRDEAAA